MASEVFDTYDLDTGSPPKPQQRAKKTWQELRNTVRETRKAMSRLTPAVPSNFQFRTLTDEFGNTTTRLYFLGPAEKGRDSTLLRSDIPEEPLEQMMIDPDRDIPATRNLWVEPVFTTQPVNNSVQMSRQEQLMRERKRLGSYGITSYELSEEDGVFVIPANNSLYTCQDSMDSPSVPTEVPTQACNARLDPKICPCNTDLVAFIHDADVWVTCLQSGKELRLTYAHKGYGSLEEDYLSAGVPSYVIQEEFVRYTAYWWCPYKKQIQDGCRRYWILYEEVDESMVDVMSLFAPTGQEMSTDLYRYPKAGTNNAKSDLKLLEITVTHSGPTTAVSQIQVEEQCMLQTLSELCPWAEYLSRAGWTQDGKYIYAIVMDRLQTRLAILLISPASFYHNRAVGQPPVFHCIYQETSDIWINVHDCIYFFPQTNDSEISFIFASEKSGYRHLYLIKSKLVPKTQPGSGDGGGDADVFHPSIISEVALTQGHWVVLPKEIQVDESRGLVYFTGHFDTPLESHLYIQSYKYPAPEPLRLTELGFSHSVDMSQDLSKFVTVYSSIQTPPQSAVHKIKFHDNGQITAPLIGELFPSLEPNGYSPPHLFQYPSRAGHVTYGLYFLPKGCEHGKRYPTILFVYGGPQVQLVTNSFKGQKFLRLHTLANEGYAVVLIDGRGSNNRGLDFEGVLKNKLGTIEINDQVEGLLWLASQKDFIDLSRVAIHGWSYGGYLSLMGLVQRSDIFKLAISGAPVVSWELYDTGYTERYLGLPASNPDAYKAGSVLTYMNILPDSETKLLLIHGLIDENVHFHHTSALINQLVSSCKPHQLQVYPNERHGIRSHDASEHYKTTVLKFLQDHL